MSSGFAYERISGTDYIAAEAPECATVLCKFDDAFQSKRPFAETAALARGTTAHDSGVGTNTRQKRSVQSSFAKLNGYSPFSPCFG